MDFIYNLIPNKDSCSIHNSDRNKKGKQKTKDKQYATICIQISYYFDKIWIYQAICMKHIYSKSRGCQKSYQVLTTIYFNL